MGETILKLCKIVVLLEFVDSICLFFALGLNLRIALLLKRLLLQCTKFLFDPSLLNQETDFFVLLLEDVIEHLLGSNRVECSVTFDVFKHFVRVFSLQLHYYPFIFIISTFTN